MQKLKPSVSSALLVALFEAECKRIVSIEQNTLASSYNVRTSYSDPFRETEDEGRTTALAFVLRRPSSVQVVKRARMEY